MLRFFSNLTHKFLTAIALIRFLSKIVVNIDIIVVLVAHVLQAEGDGFDPRGRQDSTQNFLLLITVLSPKLIIKNARR